MEIRDYDANWSAARAHDACAKLEAGEILFFEQPPFNLPAQDLDALVALRPSDSRLHKNISYRPSQDLLRGFSGSADEMKQVHDIMRRYYRGVVNFVSRFLAPYADKFQIDYASFRPLEEEGRDLPFHKRNDLLHVDAFPSRPTRGGRILRVFTNANPTQARVWKVGPRFPELADNYATSAGLPKFASTGHARRSALHALRSIGVPVPDRSAYDEFMLRFHDWLKENQDFQSGGRAERLDFPPFSTWLVFTDGVPHAALSGQFALEQTFIIPPHALVSPQVSPIRVLESLAARKLA
jgi:3-deoxy-D-manno-octulosonic acid hydroxylase-like protein